MAVQDYKINYKSDFVLTINGDAGWAIPFCIKFWTGMPSQAYFVGFNGVKYVNCRVGDTPTQLLVMFDDHHLPIGPLKMQIAYHTTIEEFPGSVFDEVTNARDVIVTIDGTDYQVLLDFTGEDAPELEFDLPAYANEAERIQNELQRQQNEADRISAELQREQATAAAVQGAENVNAQLNGTTLTVTNRQGVSTSVNTKGEQGEQGPVGPEGPQGEQGVSIVSFRQVYASETATYYSITFSDGHEQSVAIPKGAKGDTGATGPTGPQGPQGDTGVSITGFVETGETETDTLYNITFSDGTTQAVAIPKGEKGDQGEQGPVGPQGPMGDVAVITPEQQAAFTMYSVPGQNTNGPMTQKAVTDALDETNSNISLISGIGTPFAIGGYKGELANYIQYTDNANRLRVELPLYDNMKLYIKDSSYMFQGFLLLNQVPTSDWYQGYSYIIDSNIIYTQSVSAQVGTYKKMLVVIRKTDNSNIDPTITSIDNILGVESVYGVPAYNGRITKKLRMMGGALSTTHGLYSITLPIGYAHTPRFIKISGKVTINTLELHGYICWYDENQTYLFYTEFDTLSSISTLTPPNGAKLFRISINGRDGGIVKDSIEIECDDLGYSEEFQKLPTDSGYQNVTFVVDVDTCIQPSSTNSELTRQYTKSTDSGVLHLPSNYSHDGKPTPLIIFIHGQADRYTNTSTRFSSDNRYAPEWDAAGYAQLDIDLIPDMYNYTGTDFADTSDDVACIEGAYEWVINHFNIARDGVYLMGRSRGAQAVMQVLGHYDNVKIPVLSAISNAGANALVNYELYRNSSDAEWTLFCTAFGLPSSGRPSYTSKSRNNVGALISNSDIADFLRENIDIWWDKSLMGLPMLEEYPEIPADPSRTYPEGQNNFHLKLYDLIVRSFKLNTTDANYGKEYCEWLNQCVMRSPVPLRFDWCNGDQTQQNWDDGHYNYAYYCVKACLNDRIGGKSVFRYWPEAGVNKPAGETTTNPHWHEYMNYVNGNFTLSDGITISNPSMARLEWLLWCQKNDRRYNGSINPT